MSLKDKDAVWSKDRLKAFVEKKITLMFSSILDFAQTAVDSEYRFSVLRSKILREGNEAIRSVKYEIDKNYEVKYTEIGRDIIKVSRDEPKPTGGKQ